MKTRAALLLVAVLAACVPASISRATRAGPLFDAMTVGGAGYPVEAGATRAHPSIGPGRPLASSVRTFVHGGRLTGEGGFSITPGAYRDPAAPGSVSSALVSDTPDRPAHPRPGNLFRFR